MAGNMVRLRRRCQPAKRTREAARGLGISRTFTNCAYTLELYSKIIPTFATNNEQHEVFLERWARMMRLLK